ncbi:MAG: MSMEG_4193 family putative phosphomutase [Anaerolineales bacterium]|nr:MSMEG_4193 family putative phosphomutase [Anaerolineales bacterium]
MATIILVRHGENDWVKKKRLAGWIPGIHLNENGRLQAQDAAQRLANLPIQAIYSSPVTRCVETAVFIAQPHNLNITELPEIGEVRYGKWEGAKIKKLAKKPEWNAVQHFPSRFQFPQGEALREVQYRAVHALEALSVRHEKETILAVSHADVIKLVLAHYLGVHIDLFQRIVISPASVSILALMGNGMVRILRLNDTGPLQPPDGKKQGNETAVTTSHHTDDRQSQPDQATNNQHHHAAKEA